MKYRIFKNMADNSETILNKFHTAICTQRLCQRLFIYLHIQSLQLPWLRTHCAGDQMK